MSIKIAPTKLLDQIFAIFLIKTKVGMVNLSRAWLFWVELSPAFALKSEINSSKVQSI